MNSVRGKVQINSVNTVKTKTEKNLPLKLHHSMFHGQVYVQSLILISHSNCVVKVSFGLQPMKKNKTS